MLYRLSVIAILAAALASCGSADMPDPVNEHGGPLRFSASVGEESRAPVTSAEFGAAGSAFKVWASMHSVDNGGADVSTVFDGKKVTSDGAGVWSYDEVQYWFPLQAYNFRAVWPAAVEGVTFSSAGGENASVTVKDFDVKSGYDLMFASDRREIGTAGEETAVALKFQHLLTRITFRGRSDETYLGRGRRVIVTSAAIYGVATTGTWTGSVSTGSWTPGSPAGTADAPVYKVEYPDGLELATDGTDLFAGKDVILAIPQVLPVEARVVIECHYNVDNAHTFTFEAPFSTETVKAEWKAGSSLRYPFTVASGVFFSTPDVVDWAEMPVDSPDFKIE